MFIKLMFSCEDDQSPLQSTSLGSGSHSLFPVHTDAFGPVRMNPGGQEYVMDCPSVLELSDSLTTTTRSCVGG